jgi:uncharacterized protein YdaU (DUF1376 family)
MNFYPFHIGDYISHTYHLSDAEDLAYRRMIDMYYLSEQPFNDSLTIARKVRSTTEIVDNILREFFTLEDDGCWHNKRIDEEIARYHDRLTQASRAGKASAEARLNKRSTSVQPTKNQEPLTNNHSIGAKAPKAKRLDVDSLPTEWLEFCKTTRADLEPTAVFEQFRDYWIAQGGQKGAKLDWFATWRNWVRNQKSIAGSAISKELPLSTDQQISHAYKVECGGDPTKARFNSYYDMKKFVLDFRDKQKRGVA